MRENRRKLQVNRQFRRWTMLDQIRPHGLVADDDAQLAIAETIISAPFLVLPTVIMETVWVLTSNYRLSRADTADRLRRVLGMATATLVSEEAIFSALVRFEEGSDFADMLHIALAADEAGTSFATFDQGIAKQSAKTPIPVETLT
jgi:predicted nucleic-acid-binding protein